jgi:hypothetical protein
MSHKVEFIFGGAPAVLTGAKAPGAGGGKERNEGAHAAAL